MLCMRVIDRTSLASLSNYQSLFSNCADAQMTLESIDGRSVFEQIAEKFVSFGRPERASSRVAEIAEIGENSRPLSDAPGPPTV